MGRCYLHQPLYHRLMGRCYRHQPLKRVVAFDLEYSCFHNIEYRSPTHSLTHPLTHPLSHLLWGHCYRRTLPAKCWQVTDWTPAGSLRWALTHWARGGGGGGGGHCRLIAPMVATVDWQRQLAPPCPFTQSWFQSIPWHHGDIPTAGTLLRLLSHCRLNVLPCRLHDSMAFTFSGHPHRGPPKTCRPSHSLASMLLHLYKPYSDVGVATPPPPLPRILP